MFQRLPPLARTGRSRPALRWPWLLALWLYWIAALGAEPSDVARWIDRFDQDATQEIHALSQDRDGYLWVASRAGLFRFDGAEFQAVPLGVTGEVNELLADRDGNLWIAVERSLLRRGPDGRILTIATLPEAQGAIRMLRLVSGRVWVAGQTGLARVEAERLVAVPGSEAAHLFDLIPYQSQGTEILLAGSFDGLFRIDDGRLQPDVTRAGALGFIKQMVQAADGALWLGGHTLRRLSGLGDSPVADPLERVRQVRTMRLLSNGELWVGTHADGLHRRAADGRWLAQDPQLRGEMITSLFEDRERNVWVGTQGGLHRFALAPMGTIDSDPALPSRLLSSVAAAPDGRIWVASYGRGIVEIAPDGRSRALSSDCGSVVMGLLFQAPQSLWIASEQGLCERRDDGREIRHEDMPAMALAPALAGGFWVQGERSVERWQEGRRQSILAIEPRVPLQLLDQGPDGLWLASDRGLTRIDADGRETVLETKASVTSLLADPEQGVWYLFGNQMVLRDGDGAKFATTAFPGAWLLLLDAHDGLWQIGTSGALRMDRGPLRQALRSGQAPPAGVRFGDSDGHGGLRPSMIGSPNATALTDGRAAYIGYGKLRIGRLAQRPRAPEAVAAQVLEVRAAETSISASGHRFLPDQQPLSFRFTAPALRDPTRMRFRHRLLPIEQAWNAPTIERTQGYGLLGPGEYVFEVQAQVPVAKTLPPARLAFSILPRWHETRWARAGFVLAAILLVALLTALVLRLRFARLRAQKLRLESEVAARTMELSVANDQLQLLARTDALTGIANRRCILECYSEAWARARREGKSLAALMIDVDHFKAYNDHHGHAAGDAALRAVASALAGCVRRPGEQVARYGGEEFITILPNCTREDALRVAERMRVAVSELAIVHRGRTDGDVVTVSIGVAATMPDSDAAEALLARADAALYQAKHAGRNRVAGEQERS